MKKIILFVVIIGMFGFATYEFVDSKDETNREGTNGAMITSPSGNQDETKDSDKVGISKGEMAPDFTLETLDGEKVRLSDYRGGRVIVNFWATWCPPCRAEIPDLQKLDKNKDVTILAVNLTQTEESEEKVSQFVDDFGMSFPVLKDASSIVATTYQVQAYPTSYMIDSNGRIQSMALGAMNYDRMVQAVENMD